MSKSRVFCLLIIVGLAALASPAGAGEYRHAEYASWWRAHHAIYHMENRIAFLEAHPDADDSYKGPAISKLHGRVLRVRAAIGPRWPHWPSPCCYSRKPIYLR